MCIKEEKNSQSSLSPSFPVNRFKAQCRAGQRQERRQKAHGRRVKGSLGLGKGTDTSLVISDISSSQAVFAFCFLIILKKRSFTLTAPPGKPPQLCCSHPPLPIICVWLPWPYPELHPHPPWSLSTFLVSAGTLGDWLTSEDLKLGTTNKTEHLSFWVSDTVLDRVSTLW